MQSGPKAELASGKTLVCVQSQPDGWARGEREWYGGPRDVISLSLIDAQKYTQLKRNVMTMSTLPGSECECTSIYYY